MVLTGKEKQSPFCIIRKFFPVLVFIGIIFLVLQAENQQRPLSRDTSIIVPPEECFERDSEPDSGHHRSNIGASAVMIGLPFKN